MNAARRTSKRVVLVAPVPQAGDLAVARTLDGIASYGWTLVGMITPDRHLDALRLVLDGQADMVVAVEPEHLPSVQLAPWLDSRSGGSRRTHRLPRPEVASAQRANPVPAPDDPWSQRDEQRRPRLVPDTAIPCAPTEAEPERTHLIDRESRSVGRRRRTSRMVRRAG